MRGRLGLQSVPAHLPWPLSLRNQGKACCSSSGLPRRCTTSRVLVGIDAATERSRLFPTEGRAGMWCSPVPAPPRDTRPGPAGARRAAGGRPGARVPGQGPTVGWAQPGLPGGFFPPSNPSTQPPERRSEVAQFTSVFSSNHRLACAVSRLSALEPSRRRPLEGPPRGQGRRVTGRPSPPRSKSRAALPDQQPASLTFPSPTSSSSGSMYDPNDVPDNISGARDDAPMEMKPLPANVPQRSRGSFCPACSLR